MDGRFGTENKPDAAYQMTFTESKAHSQSKMYLGTVEVIAPGVCFSDIWCGHGSLFVYDGREDVWIEIDLIECKSVNKWVRILGEAPANPWVNTSHPADGQFEVRGTLYGKYTMAVKDSMLQGKDAKSAELIVPGVCNIPYWYSHGSVFVYNAKTDQWVEIHAAIPGASYTPPHVVNQWTRA